jgi:very-short-patch-repair endonuclease
MHVAALPRDERTTVDGIPVTTPPRTILDLAAAVPARMLERAVSQMEVLGLRDRLSLADVLERHPGRRGSAALRRLVGEPEAGGVTVNTMEDRFLVLLEEHRLPRPRVNADLHLGDRFVRPDFMWVEQRLIVETDGWASHGTRRGFEGDHERDRRLVAEGWRVMRVTWRQLLDQPAEVAADIRLALDLARG